MPEPPTTAKSSKLQDRSALRLAALFVLPSGAAALIDQVVWVRLLGLSMGSASASVGIVLAAFFLGLAAGGAWANRLLQKPRDIFLLYLKLEAGIAASSLLLLPLLLRLDEVIAALPFLATWPPARFVVAMLLLFVPTLCMGATFPVVAAWALRREGEIGSELGLLYAANTAGAVLGACSSGFLLIPALGLTGAVVVAAALNLLILAAGLLFRARQPELARTAPSESLESPAPSASSLDAGSSTKEPWLRRAALIALVGTGFSSIANEVGWTHVLSILTGTTLYGFSAILTAYLIGVAAGSASLRGRLAHLENPAQALAAGLLLLTLSLVATRAAFSALPGIFEWIQGLELSAGREHALRYTIAGSFVLVPTFLYGALFPLSLAIYCGELEGVRARVGLAYAANTLAGIAGSLLATFLAIPYLGTNRLLGAMAVLTAALVLPLLPGIATPLRHFALAGAALCSALSFVAPQLDWQSLMSSFRYRYGDNSAEAPRYLFLGEGHSGIVSATSSDDLYAKIQNNGLNESMVSMHDIDDELLTESLLGLVPYLFHPAPKDAFAIGLGGGVTSRALLRTPLEKVRVVELEKLIPLSLRAIGGPAERVLDDPRIHLRIDDARHRLLVEGGAWDIIVSQPSHPWRSGAASLFTAEFFELVDARLRPGGIFGQWINLFQMDSSTLRSLLGTFFDQFPHGFVLINRNAGDLLVFGSDAPFSFEFDEMRERMQRPAIARLLARHDVSEPAHLLRWFALSRDDAVAACADAKRSTDTNILPEVQLAALNRTPRGEANPEFFLAQHAKLDVLDYLPTEQAAAELDRLRRYLIQMGDVPLARFAAARKREAEQRQGAPR